MDREYLANALGYAIRDPYSADAIILGMKSIRGLSREELFIKEMGSPTPQKEVYGNIRCVLFRSETQNCRSAVVLVRPDAPSVIDESPWLKEIAHTGITVVGIEIAAEESPANATNRVVRSVSYLNLRRSIAEKGRIFLCGFGKHATWALIAGILDDRIRGLILVDPLLELSLPEGRTLPTPELTSLFVPRPLALLGMRNNEKAFAKTQHAYRDAESESAIRFELESGPKLIRETILWMAR
jgi:hypothetical protein